MLLAFHSISRVSGKVSSIGQERSRTRNCLNGVKMFADCVVVYDNEPRNTEIVGKIEQAIKSGYTVCVWGDSVDEEIKHWIEVGKNIFKEYKEQEANQLIDCLNDLFKKYGWMTDERVDYILQAGMRGQYGDFYHVNEKTVNTWIMQYYHHHQSQIVQEVQAKNNQEKEATDEEIKHWIEVGKNIFKENYKLAKETGTCAILS